MSKTKALGSPVVFVFFIASLLLAIGFLGPKLRRTHYIYTSAADVASSRSQFPTNQKLTLLKAGKLSGDVSLSQILDAHPGGIILNFWATWCPPCIEELPSLELLARQLDAKHDGSLPSVVAVSVDEKAQDVFGLMKTLDFHSSLQILHDKDGAFARSVGTTRFPETYLIASSGEVLYKWVGPQNWVSTEVIERLASLRKSGQR